MWTISLLLCGLAICGFLRFAPPLCKSEHVPKPTAPISEEERRQLIRDLLARLSDAGLCHLLFDADSVEWREADYTPDTKVGCEWFSATSAWGSVMGCFDRRTRSLRDLSVAILDSRRDALMRDKECGPANQPLRLRPEDWDPVIRALNDGSMPSVTFQHGWFGKAHQDNGMPLLSESGVPETIGGLLEAQYRWRRVHESRECLGNDMLIVVRRGLLQSYAKSWYPIAEDQEIRVTSARANEIGMAAANEVRAYFESDIPDFEFGSPTAVLKYVPPNDMYYWFRPVVEKPRECGESLIPPQDFWGPDVLPLLRLAWVVTVPIVVTHPPLHRRWPWVTELPVYVDADTGEVIGFRDESID